jgi:hypothetical protein
MIAACKLVSVLVTRVIDRLHPPFAAVAFSAVVSLMPTVRGRDRLCRIDLDRPSEPRVSADEHRHERRHGISWPRPSG